LSFGEQVVREYHKRQAQRAREIYVQSRTPDADAEDWNAALRDARRLIGKALRASDYLRDIAAALTVNGEHARIFRHLLAPPLSQDQFALCYPDWTKSTEKPNGKSKPKSAAAVAQAIQERRVGSLTPWLISGRKPTRRELERLFWSVSPLLANQQFATVQRNRLAKIQEGEITSLLDTNGWAKLPASLLDTKAALPLKHYMHKTRFATATTRPQEVDIALGLKGTIVLAMECKVTNDVTNSIKRINDILKKAHAWKEHWGNFVRTAALLQGVIAEKDVMRLLDGGVEVFWSHDLPHFELWLSKNI
jgi:hypothetical protein